MRLVATVWTVWFYSSAFPTLIWTGITMVKW